MPSSRGNTSENTLITVDITRRLYGRRYTGLPVDTLDRTEFTIDCSNGYMRPDMFDLQVGDNVRWQKNGRYVQGHIATIERTETLLRVALEHVAPLPTDFFPW